MLHPRLRVVAGLSGLVLATIGVVPAASALNPGSHPAVQPVAGPVADHNIKDVQARVDKLYHQAEVASEQLNNAKLQLADLRRGMTSLQADQDRQNAKLQSARSNLQNSIIDQYEGQSLSAMGAVTNSGDPDAFVSQVSTLSAYNAMQGQLFDDFTTQAKALDLRTKATAQRAAEVQKLQTQLTADKATIEKHYRQAKDLLDNLQAKQREELLSRASSGRTIPVNVDATGRAAIALHYALAQVGKPYVYGAAGPSAFDCSGLMMAAWGAAGVGLPHSSSAQSGSGPHIAPSDLQPGDLVFYYSPISHVGMYIGNGLVVAAQNPSVGVQVVPLYSMPYSGAVRPG